MNKKVLGNGLLLLTALIWGTAFSVQRAGMALVEPITFNAARMLLAAIAIGSVSLVFWQKERHLPQKRTAEEHRQYNSYTIIGGICCGFVLAMGSILQQMGIVYTTAGKAGFITAMYIVLVPVVGHVFLKKRNTWLVWLAVLLCVVGMYFLCMTEDFRLAYGDLLVCVSSVFFCGHILCCDHFAGRGNPIRISAIQFAVAAILSSGVAVMAEEPGIEKLYIALPPIIYCGIVSGGIGYTLQIVAQKYTDPTIASLLMSMESVFAVIAGALLLHEQMSIRELSGCCIMFTAIILAQIPLPKVKQG